MLVLATAPPAAAQDAEAAETDARETGEHPRVLGRAAPSWDGVDWTERNTGPAGADALAGRVVAVVSAPLAAAERERLAAIAAASRAAGDDIAILLSAERESAAVEDDARALGRALGRAEPVPVAIGAALRERYGVGERFAILHDRRGIVRAIFERCDAPFGARLRELLEEPRPNPLVGKRLGGLEALRWHGGAAPDFADRELTLVRFWTIGCPFCRASLPALAKLAERHAPDLALVAVYHEKSGRDRPAEELLAAATELGVAPPIAFDPDWTELRRLLRAGRLSTATSVSFLVDRRGIVRWVHEGPRLHPDPDGRFPAAAQAFAELEHLVAAWLDDTAPPSGERDR